MIRLEDAFKSLKPQTSGPGERPFTTEWTVPADLPYFDGHFPQNPVFPAVGILDASVFYLQSVLGQWDLELVGIVNAKFLNPIAPGQRVSVEIRRDKINAWQVDWTDVETQKPLAALALQPEQPQ